jgi:cytochrome c peroxidase
VTGQDADSYAFRTPSLRNVVLSGPYGHAGAVADLRTFVASHVQPVVALQTYDPTTAILPEFEADDFVIFNSVQEVEAISQANSLTPVALSEAEIDALVAFLNSLTDPIARVGRLGIPQTVPSGLPVEPLAQP